MAIHELTNEQLARMYGAYMGCEVYVTYLKIFSGSSVPPIEYMGTCKLEGVGDGILCVRGVLNRNKFIHDWLPFSIVKLLLTPLSQISDEDAIEVAKMLCQHGRVDFSKHSIAIHEHTEEKKLIKIGGLYLHIYFNGWLFATSEAEPPADYMPIYNTQGITDYLRSRGYDCGYGNIPSLIEAGYALDKTKIGK